MSLYRTYRPLDFSSLLGQDHVSEILQNALQQERVSHAYLFTGPRGTGKTSTARILSRAINCLDPQQAGPCNKCEICESALTESLTDLIEIDAASHGLVDDARALVEQARFMPTRAKKKIYIIDEVHMLSKSAFNALLKIIEEPPEHVHFILATTESHKVLETIKSRCQRFDFHLADSSMISQHLKSVCATEKITADESALALLAKHARGSFRDGLSLLEQLLGKKSITKTDVQQALGISEQDSITDFLKALEDRNQDRALHIIEDVHHQGHDLYQYCQVILETLRQRLLEESNPEQQMKYIQWATLFFASLDQLRDPVIPQLPLEMVVLRILSEGTGERLVKPTVLKEKSGTEKPRKVVSTDSAMKSDAKPAKKTVPQGSFTTEQFIASIQQASLKNLIKFSRLEWQNDQLKVYARSSFELEKMRSGENLSYLTELLRSATHDKAVLDFVLDKPQNEPAEAGISSSDLESVF